MIILSTILVFLLTISIIVIFHEYGHYIAARMCGIKVLQFSVGFGKKIIFQEAPEILPENMLKSMGYNIKVRENSTHRFIEMKNNKIEIIKIISDFTKDKEIVCILVSHEEINNIAQVETKSYTLS